MMMNMIRITRRSHEFHRLITLEILHDNQDMQETQERLRQRRLLPLPVGRLLQASAM